MSDEKKDSGFRGRIDRFFDKQAKEQQNLLQGKVGGTSIKDSWEEVKGKVGGKKSKASIPKAHKVKESKTTISKSEAKEVVISPLARSFISYPFRDEFYDQLGLDPTGDGTCTFFGILNHYLY